MANLGNAAVAAVMAVIYALDHFEDFEEFALRTGGLRSAASENVHDDLQRCLAVMRPVIAELAESDDA